MFEGTMRQKNNGIEGNGKGGGRVKSVQKGLEKRNLIVVVAQFLKIHFDFGRKSRKALCWISFIPSFIKTTSYS